MDQRNSPSFLGRVGRALSPMPVIWAFLKYSFMAVLAVVGVIVIIMTFINVEQYRPELIAQVEKHTGRTFAIDGALHMKLSLKPTFVAEDVALGNPQGASRPMMVTAKRIEAEVSLLPMLGGIVAVDRLVLVEPDILLETDVAGKGNWVFEPVPDPAAPPPAEPEEDEILLPEERAPSGLPTTYSVDLRGVAVRKGLFRMRDADGAMLSLSIPDLEITESNVPDRLDVALTAAVNDVPVSVRGRMGRTNAITDPDEPFPLDLTVRSGSVQVQVEGTIQDVLAATGIDVMVRGGANTLADIGKVVPGLTLPAVGPLSLQARLRGAPDDLGVRDLDVSVGAPGTLRLSAKGEAQVRTPWPGVSLRLGAEGENPTAFLAALGDDAAGAGGMALPPVKLSAMVDGAGGAYEVKELKALLGESDLAGWIKADLRGARPVVEAGLGSSLLDLAALTAPSAVAPKDGTIPDVPVKTAPPPPDGRVIPDVPLHAEMLRLADGSVQVRAKRVVLPKGVPLDDVRVTIDLKDGVATLDPFTAQVAQGQVAAKASLKPKGDGVALTLVSGIKAAKLAALADVLLGAGVVEEAPLTFDLNLAGSGADLRALMSSLNGNLLLQLGEGRIQRHGGFDSLTGDAITQIFEAVRLGGDDRKFTLLQCGVLRSTITDGKVALPKGLGVETDRLRLLGSGVIDLGTETLDLSLQPSAKGGFGLGVGDRLAQLLRVGGTLADPLVRIDAKGALKNALSLGAALLTGGASLAAEVAADTVTEDRSPCATALGEVPAPKQAPAKAKSEAKPAAPLEPAQKTTPLDAMPIPEKLAPLRKLFGQ